MTRLTLSAALKQLRAQEDSTPPEPARAFVLTDDQVAALDEQVELLEAA
jgi:hypothetical protein